MRGANWAAVLAAVGALGASPPTHAAGQNAALGEIVVTAEKRDYNSTVTPHVTLVKRADNLITEVRVICDTRDPAARRNELKATLRNMIRGADARSGIELGLGDNVIGRFDETMLDAVIEPDAKADTSRAVVVVKTHVSASDTFDSASGRITAFLDRTAKVGRTELLREQDWSLTIIDPEQYRQAIVTKVADDARAVAAAFGPAYGVSVDGLQKPVDWYQAGPLDLALFISYKLVVEPLPH
jgi:hypothetical protein